MKIKLGIIVLIIVIGVSAFFMMDMGKNNKLIQLVDRERFTEDMPEDFNFIYKYGYNQKNELNTFTNKYVKDLVDDGTVEIDLVLSNDEKEKIYEKMKVVEVETFPEHIIPTSRITKDGIDSQDFDPYMRHYLTIKASGNEFTIVFRDMYIERDEMGEKFLEITSLIKSIIKEKDEYNKLPEPSGGYM